MTSYPFRAIIFAEPIPFLGIISFIENLTFGVREYRDGTDVDDGTVGFNF